MVRPRAGWPPRCCPGRRSLAQASPVHGQQWLRNQLYLNPVGIFEVNRRHDPTIRPEVRDAALLEASLLRFEAERARGLLAAGATLLRLDGLISDCGRLAARLATELGAFDLSTLREPYRVEGKKTMGFELAEDLGWELPDAVIYPTGGGTGLIGMWKAFDELERMGLIGSRRPRLVSVQAEGCAPIVRAFAAGERFAEPWVGARTAAAGLRVPGAVGDFLMLDAIRASGGTAVAVPETEIAAMQKLVSARTGLFVGLETGAAAAAIPHLLASGGLSAGEKVVLFDTGSGFKSTPPDFSAPRPIENREESWAAAVETVRRAAD